MKTLNIGVIGCGGIAQYVHFRSLKQIENITVAAVCDMLPERAEAAAQQFPGARAYDNYRRMLREGGLDCALVLTQPDALFRIAMDCMSAGLDVFMEKPSGTTVFQAQALCDEAIKTGRMLQVGLNRRYIPLVRHVMQKLRNVTAITQVAGCFIKHDTASFYGGCADAFTCDTIHAIDLIRYLAGADRAVAAATVTMRSEAEGITNAWNSVMRFDNGVTGTLTANYATGGRVHTFEAHGPSASAFINLGFGGAACEAKIIYHQGNGMYSISASGSTGTESGYEFIDGIGLAGSPEYHSYYGYLDELVAFFAGIRGEIAPDNLIGDSLKSMQLMEYLREHTV